MLEIVSRTNVSKKLLGFLDSQDLPKALLMAFSLIVPIVVGYGLNHLQLGIYVALGAFLVSANDIDGSIRLKVIGLLIATALSMGVLLLSFYMPSAQWVALLIYGILIFCLSYLSVFGFRASLISFSGLFALVMSFSTLFESEYHVFFVVMMVGIGGLWYALLVLIRYFLFYKKQMEFYLSEAFELTSQLMGIRSELIDPKCDRKRLLTEMLDIQSKLTTNHEVLRELLIMNRRGFSNSSFQTIRLNVFTDLVDMLELAIANPVQYDKMDLIMRTHSRQLTDFQELLNAISRRLRFFGKNISRTLRLQDDDSIRLLMQKVSKNIASFIPKADNGVESTLMLTNYQKYLQNQSDKVAHIERSLKSGNVATKQSRKRDDSLRFLTKQDYNPTIIIENFNLQSPMFRHSLRIAIVSIAGFALGQYLDLDNAYWILLTIVVIMRPSYGLTNERSRNRIIGTIIGGIVAYGLILWVNNHTFNIVMSILTFIIGISMLQTNYKTAAAFITMQVIFTFALIEPNVAEIIQFRVLNTLIGAALATLGVWLLLPTKEISTLDKSLLESIRANRFFLLELSRYYNTKVKKPEYKILRKKAFLSISELNSVYQRILQEPKQDKENMDIVYQVVLLQYSFLTSIASLGSYITNNPTTPASLMFNRAVKYIDSNLTLVEELIKSGQEGRNSTISVVEDKEKGREPDIESIFTINNVEQARKFELEESHLVMEQLQWLSDLSRLIPAHIRKIKFEKQRFLPEVFPG